VGGTVSRALAGSVAGGPVVEGSLSVMSSSDPHEATSASATIQAMAVARRSTRCERRTDGRMEVIMVGTTTPRDARFRRRRCRSE
jgi:hypothetical protein